jgi:NitT/TauT family transport system substrate-binding protein
MKKPKCRALALAGAIGLTFLTGCSGGGSENSMSLMLDVGYLPKHAPFFAAAAHGFFKAEGIDLTIMPGSGSTNTVTAVETGKVDAGWADFGVTVLNQARGAKVKQVNLLQARSAYAVVALADSGIKDWDDLKGKTVATEGAGAMTSMWPLAMNRLGLQKNDVNVVHASSGSKIPGLLAGQWDANLALYVSDAPAIDAIGRQPVVLKWSDLGIDLYGNGIVFSDDRLSKNPDQVRRFNLAMQRGFLWACQNPDEAALDFQRDVQGYEIKTIILAIREQCALSWGSDDPSEPFGLMSNSGVEKLIDVGHEFLGLPEDSTLTSDQIYTNSFLDPLRRNEIISAP